jgi:hypothetical protein
MGLWASAAGQIDEPPSSSGRVASQPRHRGWWDRQSEFCARYNEAVYAFVSTPFFRVSIW